MRTILEQYTNHSDINEIVDVQNVIKGIVFALRSLFDIREV